MSGNRAAITRCNRRERWVDESIRRREALTRAVLENAKTDEEKSAAAALELYVDRQQVLLLAQISDAALGEAREIKDEAQAQQENGGHYSAKPKIYKLFKVRAYIRPSIRIATTPVVRFSVDLEMIIDNETLRQLDELHIEDDIDDH
ncbi:hypothetical protein L3Y34_019446 [Caenorhabditis briggsae]|uniref:Uncharacterized protein n=1 Tax=Caenorhabditis briggsae TaxID=6238 RepID=A0AAE9DNP0_CAEBR|nr:hypothetical protein L3Y34_019446 [Caenorhabditis briggsae]